MSAYATVDEANDYFNSRLYSTVWNTATNVDKEKSLSHATRIIDRLNFAGAKHAAWLVISQINGCATDEQLAEINNAAASQELEFPRGSDETVPSDIKIASYEIAFALLDGVDPDIEFQDQGVISQGYSSVRTTYDRSIVQEHTNAGIPSPTAWRYLKPYCIAAPGVVKISRVS